MSSWGVLGGKKTKRKLISSYEVFVLVSCFLGKKKGERERDYLKKGSREKPFSEVRGLLHTRTVASSGDRTI